MKRRTFLKAAAAPLLLAVMRAGAAANPLLFHEHGHGLAFSADGKVLFAPTRAGLAAYEDHVWWEAGGPPAGFSGFSVTERAIYASGHASSDALSTTAAGLMRSIDGGRTWEALALGGLVDFPLLAAGYRSGAIYVLNVRPNQTMAVPGLFLTRDEGKTWSQAPARGLSGEIHALAAHPRDAAILAVGTNSGLYVSHDAAGRFLQFERRGPVTAVAFDSTGERLLYAKALSNEIFEQALAGSGRHTRRAPVAPGDYLTCLAQNPADARVLAFATRRRDVYLTRDGGQTWNRIAREGKTEDAEERRS